MEARASTLPGGTPATGRPRRPAAGRSRQEPPGPDGLPGPARGSDPFRFRPAPAAGALDPREAYALWEREGRPRRERYGLTVGDEGTRAWPDDPRGPHVWPLPS
ncbi:hypothetical protein [Streptomyces sp.]|uniref:hypothetical protein n=1 Tax=Streptomyces sp. TaxID=1931 RepID=UPI0035C71E33